ncbi:hypothetical protein HMSSN036_92380 [Paenibacillus macerans]|nr:hypothetical protein HMSSN036_92380 [Paenibacillus macerans]
MTLGITIFGILQSHALTAKLTEALGGSGAGAAGEGIDFGDPYVLLNPEQRQSLDPTTLGAITEGLASSIAGTFAWSLIPAVLALVSALFMTKENWNCRSRRTGLKLNKTVTCLPLTDFCWAAGIVYDDKKQRF